MRGKLVVLVLVSSSIAGSACHRTAAPDELVPAQPHTLRFDLYSAARQFRSKLEARGAPVSQIEFVDGAWSLSFGLPPDAHTRSPGEAEERSSEKPCFATGAEGTGIVACRLYSMSRTERELMNAEGWGVEPIYFDPEARKWAFRWTQR